MARRHGLPAGFSFVTSPVKTVLAILAAVLLLAGCGQAKDPFVRAWQAQTKDGPSFVISKHEPGYLVRAGVGGDSFEGVGVLDGQGHMLTACIVINTGRPAQVEKIRLTESAHNRLEAIDEGVRQDRQTGPGPLFFGLGLSRVTLVRVSSSTTPPTPSP